MGMREDREFREFRNLMHAPDSFSDGFGWRTVLMALFVGLIMAPASEYMVLVAGMGLGGAAKWVTVILYVEVCRRAFVRISRPEIFVLFYMCGAALGVTGHGLLWKQFLMQSEQFRRLGLTEWIPAWFAPSDPEVLNARNFLVGPWMMPVALGAFMGLINRIDDFGLGYILFRLTADVERLPFPMAPVGAMGMTALADSASQKESWRLRVFSMGAAAGIIFGMVYLAVPVITGAVLAKPIKILPIPFVDLTRYTEGYLPAMPMMISFNLGAFVTGMVMPFMAMMGSVIGLLFTLVFNPVLHRVGVLDTWEEGLGGIQTVQVNTLDFYFSFGIGLSFAVAAIGFIHLHNKFKERQTELNEAGRPDVNWSLLFNPPKGRGDLSVWLALGIYITSTLIFITVGYLLVNHFSGPLAGSKFPLWLLCFYGFVYTPVISYVAARMEGIVGQQFALPMVREATFILSGYKGAAIWFAPIPMRNEAKQALEFRTMELTGTKFTFLIKAECILWPLGIIGGIMFAQFIWSMGPVPSAMFPYANEFWELQAYHQGLIWTATLPGEQISPFREAFRWDFLGAGFGMAVLVYAFLARFNLPVFLVYGIVRGLDQTVPQAILPTVCGALFGRFFCRRRFGKNWPRYRVVFAAGFGAGMGLIAMLSMGFVFMTKSVINLPY
jgi:hypothetical protein